MNLEYADEAFAMALTIPRNAVQWLRAKDLHTRGIMTKKLLDGWIQGEALRYAMDKTENAWTDKRTSGAAPEGDWKGENDTARIKPNRYRTPSRSRSRGRRGGRGGSYPRERERRGRGGSYPRGRSFDRSSRDRGTPSAANKGNKGFSPTLKGGNKPCIAWNMGNCSKGGSCVIRFVSMARHATARTTRRAGTMRARSVRGSTRCPSSWRTSGPRLFRHPFPH